MDELKHLIDFILHIDQYLPQMIHDYGTLIYGILFLIIFSETGFVVTPFLPGDSLLFGVGMIAGNADNHLNFWVCLLLLCVAAVLGNTINYQIGRWIGPKVFSQNSRLFKMEYLERTQKFYTKYGGNTIILSRFIPIVRTFAPFVAGVGKMDYKKFLLYNLIGGCAWVILFLSAGYFFGGFEVVQKHFEFIALGIIVVSLLPVVFGFLGRKIEID